MSNTKTPETPTLQHLRWFAEMQKEVLYNVVEKFLQGSSPTPPSPESAAFFLATILSTTYHSSYRDKFPLPLVAQWLLSQNELDAKLKLTTLPASSTIT